MLLKKLGWWDELTDGREGRGRRQELEDRQLRRHHPRDHEEPRLPSRSATPRRARWCGTSRTRFRSTASRCTARGPTWSPSTRRTTTRRRSGGCPRCTRRMQQKNLTDKVAEKFPLILTSGRLTEYEGGGEETRSNPWLAELQQEAFVEINPKAAADARHQQRRPRLAAHAHRRPAERAGDGDRAGRARHLLDAVPLLRPLAGRRHAGLLPERRGAGGARRGGEHRHDLRLRQRDDDAGNQDDDLQRRDGH